MKTINTLSATRQCGILIAVVAVVGIAHVAASESYPTAFTPERVPKAPGGDNCPWPIRSTASSPHVQVAVSRCGKLLASSNGTSWRPVEPDVRTFFRGVTLARGVFVVVGDSYVDLPGVLLTSTDGNQWTIRHCGRKMVFQSVTYGNGVFVVVGDRGAILTSKEGANWTAQKPVFDGTMASVAFGGGRFVAVGDDGMILASLDGRHWAKQSSGITTYLAAVGNYGFEFVATDRAGTITSRDGLIWTKSGGETNLALQHASSSQP